MVALTEEQIDQRWDTLPMTLREALTSDVNSDYVWKVSGAEHIPDQKIFSVGRSVSHVLFGFIHPEDLSEELVNSMGLDAKIASSIATAINQRIFTPLRPELDKVYQPINKPAVATKAVRDVAPGPQIISQVGQGIASITGTALASNRSTPAPAPVPPPAKPPTQSGWSRSTTAEPVVKLSQTVAPLPRPAQAPNTTPTATRPSSIPTKGIGEFERMSMQKTPVPTPGTPVAPSAPSATPPSAPVMLHEDASFKAAPKAADFRLNLPAEQFMGPKTAMPSKPAVLEFGKMPTPPPAPKPAAAVPSNTVHYTDYIKQNPGVATERKITEITSAPTTPSMPATPSTPIKPTTPTSAPKMEFTMPGSVNINTAAPASPAAPRPVVAAPPLIPPKPQTPMSMGTTAAPQNKVNRVDYSAPPPKPPQAPPAK